MSRVAIFGPGRVGLALAQALQRSGGVSEVVVHGRRPEPPSHPLFEADGVRYVFGIERLAGDCLAVFLSVPDEAVPEVAYQIAAQGPAPEGCAAFHTSGALPTDVLAPLHAAGYEVGAFHPWILLPRTAIGADRFVGARIGVTASPVATRVARDVADAVGAAIVTLPANRRAMAHAATTLASTMLPVLLDHTVPLLEEAGLDRDEAVAALAPLARSVLAEVEASGTAETLAAVLSTSDLEALDVPLRALDGEDRRMYAWLVRAAARRAGAELDPDERDELVTHFEHATRE